MKHHSYLKFILFLITLLLPTFTHAAEPIKPNIVLVMADDQGWGDMAYNGHAVLKTPHFDAMAASSLRFDQFYAACPVCSPTRGSVLTGRHPNRFGCFQWGHSLRPQEVTIAEALQKAGYATGHFGKWHLGSVRKGSPVNPGASGFDEWLSAENFYDNDAILSHQGKAVQLKGESSLLAVDAAIDFMHKQHNAQQPFLAVVWFGSPHVPHVAIEKDRALYNDQPKKFQHFYGEITGMDRAFGKLRNEIKTMGIKQNTVLWYCSDNGGLPKVGSTGGRSWKGTIYEGGLRVPAMLEWPARFTKASSTNIACNTVDIYPTVLEMAGVKNEKTHPLDGISLTPLIDGKMKQRTKPMGFWNHAIRGIGTPSKKWMTELLEIQKSGKEPEDKSFLRLDAAKIKKQYTLEEMHGHAAWLDFPYKLHRIQNKNGKVRFKLYHLSNDRMEKKDISKTNPERFKKMQAELAKWQTSVINSLNGKDY